MVKKPKKPKKLPKKVLENHPLTSALKILVNLGESGELVWKLGEFYATKRKDPYTTPQRIAYLNRAIAYLKSKLEEDAAYREKTDQPMYSRLPVDFQTFIESPRLMNKNGILWPRVMEAGLELNSGKYSECVLTGAIGSAKSTLAIYTQAYQTYILSCMCNPHEVFDLDPSSEILIIFQSINKNVATDVDYRRLRDAMEGSHYFNEVFPFQKDRESEMRFPRRIGIKPVAGHDQGAIGQNVVGGILDEVNFMAVVENSKQSTTGGTYDQATANYNSIASRRQSRFMQLGFLPGMLCLVSSRNYPGQFTDKKEEEAKTNNKIYIYDKRLWELRPERFCGDKFKVFKGDATRRPRIIEEYDEYPKNDAPLILEIPVEYKHQFTHDILNALREVAGVSTQAMHPFMLDVDAIAECFDKRPSILSREDCDFHTSRVMVYPKRFTAIDMPRFAHIDPSLSRDSTGLAVGYVSKFVEVDRGEVLELLPVICIDLLLDIRPPRGGEIQYSNVRRLLYTLRDLGLPIKWVTSDTFQSVDNLQQLRNQGFTVGNQSMDVNTDAYDVTKQVIYDGRLHCPKHPKAQKELATLELDPVKLKIDHPPHGSKDISDALAGVVYGLTRRREIWSKHGVSPHRAVKRKPIENVQVETADDGKSYTQRLKENRYS